MNRPKIKHQFSVFLIVLLFTCLAMPSAYSQDTTNTDNGFEEEFSIEDDVPAIASYSLNDCIQYAFQYSESIKLSEIDVKMAHEDIGVNIARGLPKIDAGVNYQHNLKIQRVFVAGSLGGGGDPDQLIPIELSTKYTGSANITLSQLLFDFSYLLGLKAARAYEDLTKRQVNLSKIEVTEQVSKAFYAVLIARERLELLDQNYKRLDSLLRETQALFENGFAEQIDVMRTEVSLNNIKVDREKAISAAALTEQVLKFQMGMPLKDSLIINGSLEDIDLDRSNLLRTGVDYENRLEYDILKRQYALRSINLKYNRSLYYPRLEGVITYGSNTGALNFGDLWKFNQNWFGFGYYGINLVIPIMNGFQGRHNIQKDPP